MAELRPQKKGPFGEQESFKTDPAAFRELKSELYMKRNEVTKLKSELEDAHHQNHNLKQSLENSNKALQENKITMEMFMKRTQDFEPKFYEKRDALIKLELQYKMETAQNNAFREDLQKLTIAKSQLIRQVDVLEEKRKRDVMYRNDITQKLEQLKNVAASIKGDTQAVKEEQRHVVSLSEKVDLAQESIQKCVELSSVIDKLKLQKDALEEQCIKYKAKSDELASFISSNHRIVNEDNLEARILLNQCKKMSAHYKQQISTKNDILNILNDKVCQEKETNSKLIKDNEDKCQEIVALNMAIKELQTKLRFYEAECAGQPESCDDLRIVKVENEVIEIKDSQ